MGDEANVNEEIENEINRQKSEIDKQVEKVLEATKAYNDAGDNEKDAKLKQLRLEQSELMFLKNRVNVDSFVAAAKANTFLTDETTINEFRKKMTQRVEEIEWNEDLKDSYAKILNISVTDIPSRIPDHVKKLPRTVFENPYGTDILTDGSFMDSLNRSRMNPVNWLRGYKSKFCQEMEKRAQETGNENYKKLYDAYKKTYQNFFGDNIIKPIADILEEVTGQTLAELQKKYLTEDGQQFTKDALNQAMKDATDYAAEKFKKLYGASTWSTIKKVVGVLLLIGATALKIWLVSTVGCSIGKMMSGCGAFKLGDSQGYTTNIPQSYEVTVEGGKKTQYCELGAKECEKTTGKADDKNCCQECSLGNCASGFNFFADDTANPCATKQCCNWEYDLNGYTADCQQNPWDNPKCVSERKPDNGWSYKFQCVNGLDSLEKLINSGLEMAKNAPGDIQGILRIIIIIVIAIGGIWVLEHIAGNFFSKSNDD